MEPQEPEPQPPLYLCPPRCFTCGKIISNHWLRYCQEIEKLTNGEKTDIPIRTINEQKLMSDDSKTAEAKILDSLGVFRYCCRRMILTQPQNNSRITND